MVRWKSRRLQSLTPHHPRGFGEVVVISSYLRKQDALAKSLSGRALRGSVLAATSISSIIFFLGAADVELTSDDLREIEQAASQITVQGTRLPESLLNMMDR